MNAKNDPATEPKERVVVITRVFDALPELVFKAGARAWTGSPAS